MPYYDKVDINEGIDPTKSNKSIECMICHYWLCNNGFKFQDHVCNDCHDLITLCLNRSDIAISLLKMLIIVVLCITSINLKQFIY